MTPGRCVKPTACANCPTISTIHTNSSKIPIGVNLVRFVFVVNGIGTADLLEKCKQENVTLAGALAAALLKTAANTKELKDKKKDDFSFTR